MNLNSLVGDRLALDRNPDLIKDIVEGLEETRKEAKPSLVGLVGSPDGTIDPIEAGKLYNQIRSLAEWKVESIAERYSPAAWLYFLRKIPLLFFEMPWVQSSPYVTSDIAEIASAIVQSHDHTELESTEPLRYKIDGSVLVDLMRFCGSIHVLRRTHQNIRSARKGVAFTNRPDDLPEPTPTESQLEAMRTYDQRGGGLLFTQRTGTVIGDLGDGEDAILIAFKDFEGRVTIPEGHPVESHSFYNPATPASREEGGTEVSTKFTVLEMTLPGLQRVSPKYLSDDARSEAAQLVMLLRLIREMLLRRPDYFVFQASQNGYIVEQEESFLARIREHFDELSATAEAVVPKAYVPPYAATLLKDLKAMKGKLWPMKHGPVIREAGPSLLVDFYMATMRLENVLSFEKNFHTNKGNRGDDLEDQVQHLINESPWGNVPSTLREVREQNQIKRHDGSDLTDIDAIGVKGDTVLIVECKSMLGTDELVLGDHNYARNRAEHLEEYVRKACSVEAYLNRNMKSPNGSYDFSSCNHVAMVVCTSAPVYVELGLVNSGRENLDKLLSTEEVLPGLRRAVSIGELLAWMHGEKRSSV